MRILVADDEFASRSILLARLQQLGSCDVACDGAEAAIAVEEAYKHAKPYDLLCLDLLMPEKNGDEVLRTLRHVEAQHGIQGSDAAKVIMTTAVDEPSTVMGAFTDGCESYLVKPIEPEALQRTLRELHLID